MNFYRDVMGLAIYRQKEGLTGFLLGPRNYLMAEFGGVGPSRETDCGQNPLVLRSDIPRLVDTVREFQARGANF